MTGLPADHKRPRPQPTGGVAVTAATAVLIATAIQQRPRPTLPEVRAAAWRLLRAVLPSRRAFAVQLWDGSVLPATEPETARLILRSPDSLGRMLRLPLDVAMGEAYLRGDYDIEGDVGSVAGIADTFDAHLTPTSIAQHLRDVEVLRRQAGGAPPPPFAQLEGQPHSRKRDRQAITYHYDVSNNFYQLWLDRRMVYSCAYFPNGSETLDEAQHAKLELICRKLRLKPGERLLDIGCGWGGLAIYAAQHHGVQVLGVTLSERQLREGRQRVEAAGLAGQVKLELLDYRDVRGEFDKISSVGMAEHVGRRQMSAYFAKAYAALRPGGLMLNHAISDGLQQARVSSLLQSGNFARRYVFPDGELLSIWETLKYASEALFEVRDVENLREHYAQTLKHWAANLEREQASALAEVGPERFRLWRLYLNAAAYYFENGHLSIFQALLAKPDEQRRVDLPRSRADLYR
ncbi:SAM-dependent methyltransferase [Deinococcus peraridilitoris]|uniref:Methyltransferase, cyclopropane fatty acid synthase n=1 Tax=Deinococcus peraridilitoris (strain DSM 19664 / LMG 22246 / CIP 109416 / KR-200) TaxID=937777 RepID=L0A8C9_DEIPD|nr:cyclopropane-fatty-acyl-phospholipid synthase family protein [Deinococcus peraridilitoris]AFZ69437.1 methyltransferase, cyclopropane fatty acid synthase [Deinococcus peraridilitoris DSM 19664]